MAEAIFDEHPLAEYLREAGETVEAVPGCSPEFIVELEHEHDADSNDDRWLPEPLRRVMDVLRLVIATYLPATTPPPVDVERFKYDVISSSLLASSLPVGASNRRSLSPLLPGKFNHSRASSVEHHEENAQSFNHFKNSISPEGYYLMASVAFAAFTVLFSSGHAFIGMLVLGFILFAMYLVSTDSHNVHEMTPTLDCLHDLIAANDVWDSVVQESITVLEDEERNTIHPSSLPSSPSSSLRIALQSSLHTTQSQCDNIRHLFVALTAPAELSQLSEMYAPPSPPAPPRSAFSPSPSVETRSLSARSRSMSNLSALTSKRSTWNGSYAALASAGSPTSLILKRREKRRSDLSALLGATELLSSESTQSAPATPPSMDNTKLWGVTEEGEQDIDFSTSDVSFSLENDEKSADPDSYHQFGPAALSMHRKRKLGGLEAFGFPFTQQNQGPGNAHGIGVRSSPMSATPRTPRSPFSTISSASRFTSMQAVRHHPLSLSALYNAAQACLASKRYTCSHLLALRFDEEEGDETYWEDVRSVMALLKSVFADSAARLSEALEQVETLKLQYENPSPESLGGHSRMNSLADTSSSSASESTSPRAQWKVRTMSEMVSFAPMPSHLTRFAIHVDAISSALNDAKDHLEECVASLKDDSQRTYSSSIHRHHSSTSSSDSGREEDAALQAYERLRRELGLALRECERGRERLLDIVLPSLRGDENHQDDLPLLGHDSDESDKPEPTSPADEETALSFLDRSVLVAESGNVLDDSSGRLPPDDATHHLLMTASAHHLPLPGAEQVFEGDTSEKENFRRKRSKLSREERIALVKKARESGGSAIGLGIHLPSSQDSDSSSQEKWGPGGDVVQELKDVIWKVGERRRKLADGQVHSVVPGQQSYRFSDDSARAGDLPNL